MSAIGFRVLGFVLDDMLFGFGVTNVSE